MTASKKDSTPPNIIYEGRQAALKEAPMPVHSLHACEWCGTDAVREREIRPEQKKEGVVVKPALKAWVCETHNQMVTRNEEVASLKRKLKIQQRRVGHPRWEDQQAEVKAGIKRMVDELAAMGERVTVDLEEMAA